MPRQALFTRREVSYARIVLDYLGLFLGIILPLILMIAVPGWALWSAARELAHPGADQYVEDNW